MILTLVRVALSILLLLECSLALLPEMFSSFRLMVLRLSDSCTQSFFPMNLMAKEAHVYLIEESVYKCNRL